MQSLPHREHPSSQPASQPANSKQQQVRRGTYRRRVGREEYMPALSRYSTCVAWRDASFFSFFPFFSLFPFFFSLLPFRRPSLPREESHPDRVVRSDLWTAIGRLVVLESWMRVRRGHPVLPPPPPPRRRRHRPAKPSAKRCNSYDSGQVCVRAKTAHRPRSLRDQAAERGQSRAPDGRPASVCGRENDREARVWDFSQFVGCAGRHARRTT